MLMLPYLHESAQRGIGEVGQKERGGVALAVLDIFAPFWSEPVHANLMMISDDLISYLSIC